MLRWIWNSWFLISERLTVVGITFAYFQSPLEETQTFAIGWIAEIWVRNIVWTVLVARELHRYSYTFTKQGQELKYDPRPLMKNGCQFTVGGQSRDDMFWAMANGYAPVLTCADNPVWFVALFLLNPVWESSYFHYIHRALHILFLYNHVRALRHRNINVGPKSGLSMHPVEHIILLGSVMIHLVTRANPVHVLFHLQ